MQGNLQGSGVADWSGSGTHAHFSAKGNPRSRRKKEKIGSLWLPCNKH
jgi:hypothetical protein